MDNKLWKLRAQYAQDSWAELSSSMKQFPQVSPLTMWTGFDYRSLSRARQLPSAGLRRAPFRWLTSFTAQIEDIGSGEKNLFRFGFVKEHMKYMLLHDQLPTWSRYRFKCFFFAFECKINYKLYYHHNNFKGKVEDFLMFLKFVSYAH